MDDIQREVDAIRLEMVNMDCLDFLVTRIGGRYHSNLGNFWLAGEKLEIVGVVMTNMEYYIPSSDIAVLEKKW